MSRSHTRVSAGGTSLQGQQQLRVPQRRTRVRPAAAHVRRELRQARAELHVELEVRWEEEDRVIVIYNPAIPGSDAVAIAYAEAHTLPDGRLCAVSNPNDTELSAADYLVFYDTVMECITAAGPQIHYLVPVYGVPYKVAGKIADITGSGYLASVSLDALLALGSRGRDAEEAMYNPIYQEGDSLAGAYDPYVPFGELKEGLRNPYYLVSRIERNIGRHCDRSLRSLTLLAERQAQVPSVVSPAP